MGNGGEHKGEKEMFFNTKLFFSHATIWTHVVQLIFLLKKELSFLWWVLYFKSCCFWDGHRERAYKITDKDLNFS